METDERVERVRARCWTWSHDQIEWAWALSQQPCDRGSRSFTAHAAHAIVNVEEVCCAYLGARVNCLWVLRAGAHDGRPCGGERNTGRPVAAHHVQYLAGSAGVEIWTSCIIVHRLAEDFDGHIRGRGRGHPITAGKLSRSNGNFFLSSIK